MPKTRTLLIYGSVDIETGAKLAHHYGCVGLIVPWRGDYLLGYLHMTEQDPKKLLFVQGVEFLSVDEAIKELI